MIQWAVWIVVAYLAARELGKMRPRLKERVAAFKPAKKIQDFRKEAQDFSIQLRERGLKRIPRALDAFVLDGDPRTFFGNVKEMLDGGPSEVLKELDDTFDRVLDSKLGTPEGRAVLKAKLEVAEKVAIEVVKVAVPVVVSLV
jgi:hypothetical protein